MNKAQASIETLTVLAIGMILLIFFLVFFIGQMESNNIVQNKLKGTQLLEILKDEIKDVYFSGPGSIRKVEIDIPPTTDFEKSEINGTSLLLNVGGSDLIIDSQVNLIGSWPQSSGVHDLILTAYADYVTIYIQSLSFSPNSINVTLNQGFSKDLNIDVTNLLDSDKNYELTIDFDNEFSTVTSVLEDTNLEFSTNETKTIPFDINCENDSSGNYLGEVIFVSELNVSFPISVNCSASQQKLTIFPNNVDIDSNGEVYLQEFLVCNNSVADLTITNTTMSGELRNHSSFDFYGIIESDRCKTLELNILEHSVGEYLGNLKVEAGGLSTNADINLTHD